MSKSTQIDRAALRCNERKARQALIAAFVDVLQKTPTASRRAVASVLLQSPGIRAAVAAEIEDLRLAGLLDDVNINFE